ncbi:MAG TPA: Hsp20/alpha crystallin family protein [Methanomassiliicoccales archaeon]|jgi:HSP20 family protein
MAITRREDRLVPVGFWSPSGMMQEMEKMLDDFRTGFGDMPIKSSGARLPSIDVRDEDDQYVLEAELPGIKKDEVSVEIGEEAVIIKAQKEKNVQEQGKGYVRRERGYISFYRQIPLPADVDNSEARAKLEDGLLIVTLPKKAEKEGGKKKLDIQ